MTTIAEPRTHAALVTPPGRGAVAVVQVIGPHAVEAVDVHFLAANGKPLAAQPLNVIRFGHWGSATGEEVVVIRRNASPLSEFVEIHCHGGQAAAAAIMADLEANRCTTLECQEWLRIINADPIAAEAQIALASAPTERTAAILLDQFNGALTEALGGVLDCLARQDVDHAAEEIEGLLARAELGLHLTAPWRVVLAGPPNVGKSSLINAMLGYVRSIVYDQPGTTRDVVTAQTAIDGWPVELADTAGLSDSQDALEKAGIGLATNLLAQADLVILVSDASQPQGVELPDLSPGTRLLRVRNKVDLSPDLQSLSGVIDTSAKTGAGIESLLDAIGRTLVPQPPEPGLTVPFTHSQRAALDCARSALAVGDAATAKLHLQALLASPA